MMLETNLKQCPDCKSLDVFQTQSGITKGGAGDRKIQIVPSYSYEIDKPFYRCKKCDSQFVYNKEK